MEPLEKLQKTNVLLQPFGFSYLERDDLITSSQDAWQREFGYTALFDHTALHFNMVFDCEPIYFDYEGRTWLIEFWKGQYGINTGCEVGIYCADSIVEPQKRDTAHFQSTSDSPMLFLEAELLRRSKTLFSIRDFHWWLTGFSMGLFSHPEELTLKVSLTFPNCIMLQSFVGGLLEAGYRINDFRITGYQVGLLFTVPHTKQPRHQRPVLTKYAQWKNRLFCRLYLFFTQPFTNTPDRLLYLYYFLPPLVRRMLNFGKNKEQKRYCQKKRLHL